MVDRAAIDPGAAAALARMPRPRPVLLRRLLGLKLRVGVFDEPELAPVAPDPDADPYRGASTAPRVVERRHATEAQRSAARQLRLTRLGSCFEGYFLKRFRKEIWATAEGATHVHFSAKYERYFLASYFEDGSCLLTWSHASPRTPSAGRLVSTGGTGNLPADLLAHRARVDAAIAEGRVPIRVTDVATSVLLTRYYYEQLVPLGLARASLLSDGVGLAVLVVLARFALRVIRGGD